MKQQSYDNSTFYDYQEYGQRIKLIVHEIELLSNHINMRFSNNSNICGACNTLENKATEMQKRLHQIARAKLRPFMTDQQIKEMFYNVEVRQVPVSSDQQHQQQQIIDNGGYNITPHTLHFF